jgi:hypothetical protein
MKKYANPIQDKETSELLCRLYEDCIQFKRQRQGKKINCNFYSAITNNTSSVEKKKQGVNH